MELLLCLEYVNYACVNYNLKLCGIFETVQVAGILNSFSLVEMWQFLISHTLIHSYYAK